MEVPIFRPVDDDNFPNVPCSYYSPDNLNSHVSKYKNRSFSMINFNIRSCRKNFASFLAFICLISINFSIIVLCETWLNANIDYGFEMDNYNQFNIYRNSMGGGIKILCDSSLRVKMLNEYSFISGVFEILTLSVIGSNFTYLICAVYRPPSASISQFNDMFFENILNRLPNNSQLIVTGDININLLNPNNLNSISDLSTICYLIIYFQLYQYLQDSIQIQMQLIDIL